MPDQCAIDVRFYRLSDAIQPYFTALYSFAISCPDNVVIADRLHPEWAAMSFTQSGQPPQAAIAPEPVATTWPFAITGPTSRAIALRFGRSRVWGLGLQPAGWARYVALDASALRDRIVDAGQVDALGLFAPILGIVRQGGANPDHIAAQIDAYLLRADARAQAVDPRIMACHAALRDPDIGQVEALAARLDMGRRSLERLCGRHFGFPPKLLLRRQRFLRSLARFKLAPLKDRPRPNWSSALDEQYFDHAHFVRDFRSFMGMTPTDYAEAPHPILDRIMAQRMADQGAAPRPGMPTVLRHVGQGAAVIRA